MFRWQSPPADIYAAVEQTPATVLLESAPPPADSQLPPSPTRLFTNPLSICIANHPSQLPALFAEIERAVSAGLYAAGYFSYECAAFFEPAAIPGPSPAPSQPLAWFGVYSEPRLFKPGTPAIALGTPEATEPRLSLTDREYSRRIDRIHAYIRSGDVYQLNFTLPIRIHAPGSSARLYQRLRRLQPAPYGAFLHTQPNHRILSFSPELFFHVRNEGETRRITTRPMKGTSPRGRTTAEDRVQARWLATDPKNRAENVMIVDLLRNDLGRICGYGSVRASNLFAVERYPTLWQMTSTIQGDLRPEVGFQDIFRALFPCGSITGAPKIRAMQLIGRLEAQPRGIYTGALGFFSKEETIFNVAIRTLVLDGDQGVMGVGSGIVIDSNPVEEFRECQLKAEFLTRRAGSPTPGSFSLVETLFWDGDYPLLSLHLDRLADSADYFAYPLHRDQIKDALVDHCATCASPAARKVRLLVHADGSLDIASEPIFAASPEPLRLRVSTHRTHPADPMYFHKTTHRPLYLSELQAAQSAGHDEVLFVNLRGEVTEAAIHNVFVEKDGQLLTPPIACGLLPGVHRRHVLATNSAAREQVLTLDDLREADAIFLCNAVRGMRAAVIDWES